MLRKKPPLRLIFALAAAPLAACSANEAPPARECRAALWARPEREGAPLNVVGSWDSWAAPLPMEPSGKSDWQVCLMDLPPGHYSYRLVEDGEARLDPENALSTYEGTIEVSLLTVLDCSSPEITIASASSSDDGTAVVEGTFLTASSGAPLDPNALRARIEGEGDLALSLTSASAERGSFSFSASGLTRGKHTVVIEASDRDGRAAGASRVAVWTKPAMKSWADGVLYQIVIDRFRGDGGAALAPPITPGSRAGGTLDGVRAEIERGTFDELGVTALWLSPVYENPGGMFMGRDGHAYEPYHGYWPLDDRRVDTRIGGEDALRAVVAAAHRHGLRVLFDLVPNHVYEENPRYREHKGDGSFNDGPGHCVCGSVGCSFSDHMLSCWFEPFLPDVRWEQPAQLSLGADDALFWMKEFDADGVRIDAVPMMPRAATRRIAAALRASEAPRRALFTIGEVFTGPGKDGIESIRYHLGPDGLDAAFDFPLMWALRSVFGARGSSFMELESLLGNTEDKLRGSGAILGLMLDNHDTSRFLSAADGTADRDPWAAPPPPPATEEPYRRLEMALAFLFSLPGLPVLYHGDELAMPGAGDPDSRRVIPPPDALLPEQRRVRETVRRLSEVRRCLTALRSGARLPLVVGQDSYALLRDAGDGLPAVALFSRSDKASAIILPAGKTPSGDFEDAFTGAPVRLSPGISISMEPESFKILLPASSPCPLTP